MGRNSSAQEYAAVVALCLLPSTTSGPPLESKNETIYRCVETFVDVNIIVNNLKDHKPSAHLKEGNYWNDVSSTDMR